jgi:hypothetical protein
MELETQVLGTISLIDTAGFSTLDEDIPVYTINILTVTKQPNLKLKTWPKKPSGSVTLPSSSSDKLLGGNEE